jgi:hypothetical protein
VAIAVNPQNLLFRSQLAMPGGSRFHKHSTSRSNQRCRTGPPRKWSVRRMLIESRANRGAMSERTTGGCKACRNSIQESRGLPLVRIMCSSSQDAELYRCQDCGACWLDTDDAFRVIQQDDARRDFPEAFSDEPPGDDDCRDS